MTYKSLDEMPAYREAGRYSDRIHALVQDWSSFEKQTVAIQLVRAADSVGANVAESQGRFHYADRIQFLYYAR